PSSLVSLRIVRWFPLIFDCDVIPKVPDIEVLINFKNGNLKSMYSLTLNAIISNDSSPAVSHPTAIYSDYFKTGSTSAAVSKEPSLLSLPNEIIEMIYSQLPFIDQLRMGSVNRRMRQIGSTFNYTIDELFITNVGMPLQLFGFWKNRMRVVCSLVKSHHVDRYSC
ncbi:hypothetical protein PFISCL1PPCAC_19169, partial [Pristionchus fissidentatus]